MGRDVLLVTELFPPAIGGSSELFANIYSRLDGARVTVLCDENARGAAVLVP